MDEVAIEFLGGPWDGQVHGFACVPPFEIHVAKPPPGLKPTSMTFDDIVCTREGTYRGSAFNGEPVYVWEGEDE